MRRYQNDVIRTCMFAGNRRLCTGAKRRYYDVYVCWEPASYVVLHNQHLRPDTSLHFYTELTDQDLHWTALSESTLNAACEKLRRRSASASAQSDQDLFSVTQSLFESPHDKANKMSCVPSEDSDQPGHSPSLIRVFAVRINKAWLLCYPLSAQRSLWPDGGCPGWSESSLGAHPFCWFCLEVAYLFTEEINKLIWVFAVGIFTLRYFYVTSLIFFVHSEKGPSRVYLS